MQSDRLGQEVSLDQAGYRLLSLEAVWLVNGVVGSRRMTGSGDVTSAVDGPDRYRRGDVTTASHPAGSNNSTTKQPRTCW